MTAAFWDPILSRIFNRPALPCLSIRQPWTYRIFHEGKDVENRAWATSFRGAFLVHAGKEPDCPRKLWVPHEHMPLGCIYGLAVITDCVEQMASEWFMGPYGFVLDPRKIILREPIPYKGRLGFFDVPCGLVREAITEGVMVD